MRKTLAVLSMLAVWAPAGYADEPSHVTASGITVATPDIETMDCARMRTVLDAIDATGYRGIMPTPDDPEDAPLLQYEHRLSERYYGHCLKGRVEQTQPAEAFGHGYRP